MRSLNVTTTEFSIKYFLKIKLICNQDIYIFVKQYVLYVPTVFIGYFGTVIETEAIVLGL